MKNLRVVENGLVPIYEDGEARRVINAREMHEFLGSERQFANWIQDRIEKYGFVEGEDFLTILLKSTGGRPATEYLLTIDMGKELAMVENNEKGRQVRKYFIECEKRAKNIVNPAVTYMLPQVEIKTQQDHAMILFAQSLVVSNASKYVNEVAKNLRQNGIKIGTNGFYKWLREGGYLLRSPRNWNMPSQLAMELELFEIHEHSVIQANGKIEVSKPIKITVKGQIYFVEKFLGVRRKTIAVMAASNQMMLPGIEIPETIALNN